MVHGDEKSGTLPLEAKSLTKSPSETAPSTSAMSHEDQTRIHFLNQRLFSIIEDMKTIHDQANMVLTEPNQFSLFESMYEEIPSYRANFDETQEELMYKCLLAGIKFPDDKHKQIKSLFNQYYYESKSIYNRTSQKYLNTFNQPPLEHQTGGVNMSTMNRSRLPKIKLSIFTGEPSEWIHFKDTFKAMVHEDFVLTDLEKYHYLITSLSKEPLSIVKNLPTLGTNYHLAWKALCERYDNKRILATLYLQKLLDFKPLQGNQKLENLRLFLTTVADSIAAFKVLQLEDELGFILFTLAVRCLDKTTRESFETAHSSQEFPSYDQLIHFVKQRCRILEYTETTTNVKPSIALEPFKSLKTKKSTFLMTENSTNTIKHPSKHTICYICKQNHYLNQCNKFKMMSPSQRLASLRNYPGCIYHLTTSHHTRDCVSKPRCRHCNQLHNSLLHINGRYEAGKTPHKEHREIPPTTTTLTSLSPPHKEVLLGTAVVHLKCYDNTFIPVRVVLDSGSQCSLITEYCVKRLGITLQENQAPISGVGQIDLNTKGTIDCTLKPQHKEFPQLYTQAVVVSKITGLLPSSPVPYHVWEKYKTFRLADKTFFEPSEIDFLIGADLYSKVIKGVPLFISETETALTKTIFGWIITGSYNHSKPQKTLNSLVTTNCSPLETLVKGFWHVEEPLPNKIEDPYQRICEEHFSTTHYRLQDGRYVVSLPFKDKKPFFGATKTLALKRFLSLEVKLKKNQAVNVEYVKFMEEYLRLGHMKLTNEPGAFIIPHHCVFKEDSSTTKTRVVFDGSMRTPFGSLNDHLMTGPKLQPEIPDIILNFRRHPVAITTDIEKMFRQIVLKPEDRIFQHILWRSNPTEPILEYELCTVTYGLAPSPYQAIRTLKQLAKDEGEAYPAAAKALIDETFVDDITTGSDTLANAIALKKELTCLLSKGGFTLRKWSSNSKELMKTIPLEDREKLVSFGSNKDTFIKVLGMHWDPNSDSFCYQIKISEVGNTKRTVLSTIARIYDPLGYLSPVIFQAKYILQLLWKSRVDWDQTIPESVLRLWTNFVEELPYLSGILIPRFIPVSKYILHVLGFCDASERGFAGAIYLRVATSLGVKVFLLKAKTKLAPLKTMTIPRLELCGALLLAKIYESLSKFLKPLTIVSTYFFSDSTIVLGWLKTPPFKLHIFVANRVIDINDRTPGVIWRHIQSQHNPVDCASRGLQPRDLVGHQLWWTGPSWLRQPITKWPADDTAPLDSTELPDVRLHETTLLISTCSTDEWIKWMETFSSYKKIVKIMAFTLRFGVRGRRRGVIDARYLSVGEMRAAENKCVMLVQRHYFIEEFKRLTAGKPAKTLTRLSPFIDEEGLLRVGGRLRNSGLKYDSKHPLLLPSDCHFTNLLIDYSHLVVLHGGLQLLMSHLRLRFWILSARRIVKHRIFLCNRCYRLKPTLLTPLMGDIPSSRFCNSKPFTNVGVDYAGPIMIRDSLRRKPIIVKAYLCLFVCFATKALHLEAVSSLTTEAFIATLDRFIARRGLPARIFSDCGTNFVGAARHLKEVDAWLQRKEVQSTIQGYTLNKGIQWSFNPPSAPHFGGLWEAGVKSVKYHLIRVVGDTPLTFEEFATVLAKVEATLNSRPLYPLSSLPEDFDFLTPGHFIMGGAPLARSEHDLIPHSDNRLNRWQLIQKMHQHFWQRWRKDYLHQLQQRSKWCASKYQPAIGDLVVLSDDHVHPTKWPMARIISLHPGKDNIVRVVTVQTATTTLKRPTCKIFPLLPRPNQQT